MQDLTFQEVNEVSGGNGATALFAGVVITAAIIAALVDPRPSRVVYEPVTHQTQTPVYNAWGQYEGVVVDTYVDYQPVIVY